MKQRTIAIICLAIVITTSAYAQTKGKAPPYTPSVIDLTWAALPNGFVPADPSRLADWMERNVGPSALNDKFKKSEEITKEQQTKEQRLASTGPFGVYLTRDPDGMVKERDTCRLSYDADRERLSFLLPFHEYPEFKYVERPTQNYRKVTIKSSVKDSEGYIGSNAYGAQVSVSRVQYNEVSIAVIRDSAIGIGGSLNIAPEEARAVYDRLGCLVIFEPRAPFYYLSTDTTRPTLDNPMQISTTDRVIFGRIVSVWLVDLRSRLILRKEDR